MTFNISSWMRDVCFEEFKSSAAKAKLLRMMSFWWGNQSCANKKRQTTIFFCEFVKFHIPTKNRAFETHVLQLLDASSVYRPRHTEPHQLSERWHTMACPKHCSCTKDLAYCILSCHRLGVSYRQVTGKLCVSSHTLLVSCS